MIKVGDVCRITIQPKDLMVKILGEVGFVSEICGEKNDHARFESLKLDGSSGGAGTIPLSCLQKIDDVEWINAKAIRDEKYDKIYQECMERTRRYQVLLEEVALKYSITTKQVEEIYQELITFNHSQW